MVSIEPIKTQVNHRINRINGQRPLDLTFGAKMGHPASQAIALRLRVLKKNQEWLADSVGVSPAAVSKWMSTGNISQLNQPIVARVLGIPINQLRGAEPPPPVNPAEMVTVERKYYDSKESSLRVTDEEARLILLYRDATEKSRRMIMICADVAPKQLMGQPATRSN